MKTIMSAVFAAVLTLGVAAVAAADHDPCPSAVGDRDKCPDPTTTTTTAVPPTTTTTVPPCEEDDPCWDCETMGNKTCGPDLPDCGEDGCECIIEDEHATCVAPPQQIDRPVPVPAEPDYTG